MSRSGYVDSDDWDDGAQWRHIMWNGALKSSIRGKRGQALLKDLLAALDAMPVKELYANKFAADGEFCALGVLGARRGMDMSGLDAAAAEDEVEPDEVAKMFNIAAPLAREIMWTNDDVVDDHIWVEVEGPPLRWQRTVEARVADRTAPRRRWESVRRWVASKIKDTQPEGASHA